MLVLALILGWLLIGVVTGRVLFTHVLGDAPRRVNKYEGYTTREPEWKITRNYEVAFKYGIWSIPFWPATLSMAFMTLPTPNERRKANEIKAKQFSKRMELLDREYQQFVKETSK